MKKILFLLSFITFSFFSIINAQNSQGKADDESRISITPQVSDQQIPQGAKSLLVNKMKQICTRNGLSGDGNNPFFIMDATVDILSKELTPTAPPMHALNLQINFFIKDNVNGNIYSEASFEVKGVGKNETKAYMQALKNINVSQGMFKALVERGKNKILEFYNSQCDFVISKAQALVKQGENGEAIKVLESVPNVSKECYVKCMELLAEIEPPVEAPSENKAPKASSASSPKPSSVASSEVEIDENLFLVYKGNKFLGDQLLLYFNLDNRAADDYDIKDYAFDTRIIDEKGKEYQVDKVKRAGEFSSYITGTAIQGTPMPIEFQFAKAKSVAMFEYKYQGRTYRLKQLELTGGGTPKSANVEQTGSAASATTTTSVIAVGSKLFVESKDETRFQYKKYSPGKVKTVASSATKGEYEVLCMGDCSTDQIWSKDVITQWHAATKSNIKEGMLVMYTEYSRDINETVCFHIGKVIAVDELYKNLVTIKGWYDEISKVPPEKILIVDKSNIDQ